MVICLILGSTAKIGAVHAIGRASTVDAAYKWSISPSGGEGELIRNSGMPPKQDPRDPQTQASSDIFVPANAASQTVFNDQSLKLTFQLPHLEELHSLFFQGVWRGFAENLGSVRRPSRLYWITEQPNAIA